MIWRGIFCGLLMPAPYFLLKALITFMSILVCNLIIICGSLNRYDLCRLMCLNAWLIVNGTIVGRGVTLLEQVWP